MFKSSEVFNYMNDEAVNSENEKDVLCNTSFLQKSNRSREDSEKPEDLPFITEDEHDSMMKTIEESENLPELLKCNTMEANANSEPEDTKKNDPDNTVLEFNESKIEYTNKNIVSQKHNESQKEIRIQIINIQKQIRKLSRLPLIIQTAIEDITNQVSELLPVIDGTDPGHHNLSLSKHDIIINDGSSNHQSDTSTKTESFSDDIPYEMEEQSQASKEIVQSTNHLLVGNGDQIYEQYGQNFKVNK